MRTPHSVLPARRMQSIHTPSSPPPAPENPQPQPTTLYSWSNAHPSIRQVYITDTEVAQQELSTFSGPCGIDFEWKPVFRKGQAENPIALIQLANKEAILLIHIHHMSSFPTNLQSFLEDPDIVKAGVGIQGDARKLYNDFSVNLRNCVDLSLLARSVDNARWKGKYSDPIGLARLIGVYEDRLLTKGRITRSNWENVLDAAQREYASNDGHAGYALYTRLNPMVALLPRPPHSRCYTFDAVRGRLCEPSGMTWSAFNPDYDPGPPPPPRPPKVVPPSIQTPASSDVPSPPASRRRPKPKGPTHTLASPSSFRPPSSTTTVRQESNYPDAATSPVKKPRHRPRGRGRDPA